MKGLRLKKNSRLRLSSHKLVTAIGKWNNIEKQKQTCNRCSDRATQNEIHQLLDCPIYKDLRDDLFLGNLHCLTLSWRRPLSYRNQSIDLLSKSMDWFLYDNSFRHERVKVNYENTRAMYEICSELTIKTPEWRHWRRFGVFIVSFEQISYIVLVFHCWHWTRKYWLGKLWITYKLDERAFLFVAIIYS